ncbi:MAG: CAP domain-containing protein [Rhizomicrobium sp.]
MKFVVLLPLLALAACASTEPKAPPDPQSLMPALASRIAFLVDRERHKLDPAARNLTIDPELTRIALARARDMAEKNYLAHVAPNGDTSASLLMADDATWQGLLGENLAAQPYAKETGVNLDRMARRFLDEWVKSDPHRENLAYPAYDRTGVGAAANGNTIYVAELFAAEAGPVGPGRQATPEGDVSPPGPPIH